MSNTWNSVCHTNFPFNPQNSNNSVGGLTVEMEWMIVFPRQSQLRRETIPSVQWRRLQKADACPSPVSWTRRPWGPCGRREWSDKRETLARAPRPVCCSGPEMQTNATFSSTKQTFRLPFCIIIIAILIPTCVCCGRSDKPFRYLLYRDVWKR